ncbi:DinB family protein [Larkinella terrae]|uniref:DUF664 domain-containing protein n=1 Tax=Larkinella terrae TaxID=2025311 RepID=A0A7K0EQ07_9BACT|nr:DinB family protein [Larkinella terrae]MRS63913.1 DUF664 domain-containing protein [Larkinella terrae]
MSTTPKTEVWQRGPIPEIPPLLQPVAHAILQAREEVESLMSGFPANYLWQKPAGVASVGFHLQHLTGVLDRLFTYAKNESLTDVQRDWLTSEGKSFPSEKPVQELLGRFHQQVDLALDQLKNTDEQTLTDFRGIGRAQLPSTVLGLLFHAAEHTQRHVGQLFVTVQVLQTYPK